MDHTAGKCACGHYHPVNEPTFTPHVIESEWLDIWTWVTQFPGASWGTWVDLGRTEPKAQ